MTGYSDFTLGDWLMLLLAVMFVAGLFALVDYYNLELEKRESNEAESFCESNGMNAMIFDGKYYCYSNETLYAIAYDMNGTRHIAKWGVDTNEK